MRQALHAKWSTFAFRAVMIVGLTVLAAKRFEPVWLNGLALELRSRTIPLADVSRIELKGWQTKHVRITYGRDDRVVQFIPDDHNFGEGEATLRQLRRLILEARGEQ